MSIAFTWTALFATVYLARIKARLSKAGTIAIVAGVYLLLSACAMGWFGLTTAGYLAAFGMLLPTAAALCAVLIHRP